MEDGNWLQMILRVSMKLKLQADGSASSTPTDVVFEDGLSLCKVSVDNKTKDNGNKP